MVFARSNCMSTDFRRSENSGLSNYFSSGIGAVTPWQRKHAGLRDVSHLEGVLPIQRGQGPQGHHFPGNFFSKNLNFTSASSAAAQVHA